MNESTLKTLLQLFAIIANLKNNADEIIEHNYVESFLNKQFGKNIVSQYLKTFGKYFNTYKQKLNASTEENYLIYNELILSITQEINNELPLKERIILVLNLIQFNKYSESLTIEGNNNINTDYIKNISENLLIPEKEFLSIKGFIDDELIKIPDKEKLLIINDSEKPFISGINHLTRKNLTGQLFVLNIQIANFFLMRYKGEDLIEVNNKKIFHHHLYILTPASFIKGEKIKPIYYNEIVSCYINKKTTSKIIYTANEIEFNFRNSENGIHKFNFKGESGQLIGIMGGSGVGKSTLLNILNGKLKLQKGNLLINGYDLYKDKEKLEGLIGFIPQDDLLIEELTVYENLYYNALLCFGKLSKTKIENLITDILAELDLHEIKNFKVGSPINRLISGGQRKRLNIALELIREPSILFVDEPTSGLSSSDSLNVMALMQAQALKGKLVVVNIHQPSSQIFKMFDKLLVLDKGGYPVYFGNPLEAIDFLKEETSKVSGIESQCNYCGHIYPEEILEIIEDHDVNEFGEYISKRKTEPQKWYEIFTEKINIEILPEDKEKKDLPKKNFTIPNKIKQFKIYSIRNSLTKLKDRQFIILAGIISPVLAILLGFFSKYVVGTNENPFEYIFSKNENLPGYLFMSVVVALFIGLIISAEEIIHDRKILERESFLNLSRFSYLNSKIAFLFILSAIQMIVFVIIGNSILEIKGMTWRFFLVLFSTACMANLMGLVISSSLKSVIAIYILVPFLLVPQLLLSGTIIKFDKLHYTLASQKFVPVVGDAMASRWAYEALMVEQFKNNSYQKNFYDIEQKESEYAYKLRHLIPELENKLEECKDYYLYKKIPVENIKKNLNVLKNEIYKLNFNRSFNALNNLSIELFNPDTYIEIKNYIEKQKIFLNNELSEASFNKDLITNKLINKYHGKANFIALKQNNYNESIADMVLNNNEFRIIYQYKNNLIQKSKPIYKKPTSKYGRAHFFSGIKFIGKYEIDTFKFNLIALWFMSICLYTILITDGLKKLLTYFEFLFKLRKT